MNVSEKGRKFIKREEGLSVEVYADAGGMMTVGFGHLLTSEDEVGMKITLAEAEEFFDADIASVEETLAKRVTTPLEQHQIDCVASFTFNLGAYNFKRSTLLKKINAREFDAVPHELGRWVYAGDQDGDGDVDSDDALRGLKGRRRREAALFLRGEYGDLE